jgi:hypothetical protein
LPDFADRDKPCPYISKNIEVLYRGVLLDVKNIPAIIRGNFTA